MQRLRDHDDFFWAQAVGRARHAAGCPLTGCTARLTYTRPTFLFSVYHDSAYRDGRGAEAMLVVTVDDLLAWAGGERGRRLDDLLEGKVAAWFRAVHLYEDGRQAYTWEEDYFALAVHPDVGLGAD